MQQNTVGSLRCAVIANHLQPRRHVRILPLISRGLDRLDMLAVGCLRAIGSAFIDGIIAYGFGIYGLPHPPELELPAALPLGTAPRRHRPEDFAAEPFRDVDEFFIWLDAQSDRIRVFR